jgi:DNA-binding MarR family transcriptional regulator
MASVFPGPRHPGESDELVDAGLEVADRIAAISRRIRRAANAELEPLGVTWGQVRALRTIAGCGEPVRMSDLADRLGIARRSATSVVAELVERGLVERLADPTDRRAVAVAATRRGARLLRDLHARRRSAAREVTSVLAPAELDQLRVLLARLDAPERGA